MARWGDFVFGDGTKFGTTGLTVAEQDAFDVYAGQSPALPLRSVPVRSGCATICRFNPVTWTAGAALPHVAAGATRQASLTGVGFQQETLSFQVSNAAAYYADSALMDLVEPGAWLAIAWAVATPTADVANLGGVFRVTTGASRARLAGTGAASFTVEAVDWAQTTMSLQSGGGWVNYATDWDAARLAYIAGGGTQVPSRNPSSTDTATTYGTLAAALLVELLGFGDQVDMVFDAATWAPVPEATGEFSTAFLQVGDPGKPLNAYDWFTWLWPYLGGFYLGYRSETGNLVFLPGGNIGVDSGYYLTTETVEIGSTPLAWTTPLPRQLNKPEATKVEYFFKGATGNTPSGAGSVAGTDLDDTAFRGEAVSDHPDFPFDGTLNQTLKIVETGTVQQAAGFATFTDFCRWRLRTVLGAADTLTLAVDPAVPPPPLSTVVRVNAPDDVAGWYRLTGFTQPLGAALASWQLGWWGTF